MAEGGEGKIVGSWLEFFQKKRISEVFEVED